MNKTRPLKRGAIAGILLFAVSFLYVFFIFFGYFIGVPPIAISLIALVFTVVLTVLSFFFYKAFIVLAERNNAKILKVVSVIGIIFSILFGILSIAMGIYQIASGSYENYPAGFSPGLANTGNAGSASEILDQTYPGSLALAAAFWIFFLLSFAALTILWGVGMLKLGEKFHLAKTIGILDIVAGGIMITVIFIFVSFVLLLISGIMKIILLFNASKLYKE